MMMRSRSANIAYNCFNRILSKHAKTVSAASASVLIFGATCLYFANRIGYREIIAVDSTATSVIETLHGTPKILAISPWTAVQVDRTTLVDILHKTVPYFEYRRMADILHALELWGGNAFFSQKKPPYIPPTVEALDSTAMLRVLFDEATYQRAHGSTTRLLYITPHGVTAQRGGESSQIQHTDNILSVCAEIGTSLDTPLYLKDHQGLRLVNMLQDSVSRFEISQELEFTTVALAKYLPPRKTWTDRFGIAHSFDEIADQLLSKQMGIDNAACYGTHVLYSLSTLLRAHEMTPILSDARVKRINNHLLATKLLLENKQAPDGTWDHNWWAKESHENRTTPEAENLAKLRVTSHHLQWMVIAPEQFRIGDEYARKATQYLVHCLAAVPESVTSLSLHYPLSSHSAHVLVQSYGFNNASDFLRSITNEHDVLGKSSHAVD